MTATRLRVLGPLEAVDAEGTHTPLGGPRQRRLLAALVVAAPEPVAPAELAVQVWEEPPDTWRQLLHSYISRLRRALDKVPDVTVRTRQVGYVLQVAAEDLDVTAFEWMIAAADRDDDPRRAVDLLEQALALWRGTPYPDLAHDLTVRAEITRLEHLHLHARYRRLDALLELGRATEVLPELRALLVDDPLSEHACGLLMRAEAHSGRPRQALEVYRRYRTTLADRTGLDPPARLQSLEVAILQGNLSGSASIAARHPLVAATDSFIGRDDDLAEVERLLDEVRIVTVTGVGGVGKSRLARELVQRSADASTGTPGWVELATIRQGSQVQHAVARALDVEVGHHPSLTDAIVSAIGERKRLVVIDNCEHVLDAIADLVEHIVQRCPGVHVLATSREPLAVAGEHRYALAPLPSEGPPGTSAAAELFLDRARAAGANLGDGFEVEVVAALCRRLDGIPLAIELAAARVAALTPQALLERIDQRFRLLTAGPRTRHGRHRTLQEVVAWSYDLLTDDEAELFERLSVFVGDADLAALEAVCAGGDLGREDIAGLASSLVDKSMLITVDGSRDGLRYRMLETLRDYGRAQLYARGGEQELQRAHARHYLGVVSQAATGIHGRDEQRWARRLDTEFPQLRAAHSAALQAGDTDTAIGITVALGNWAHHRLRNEVTVWAATLAALPELARHPEAATVLGIAAQGASNRGELDTAVELARRGLEVAEAAGQRQAVTPLLALAAVSLYRGDLLQAEKLGERAADLAEDAGTVTDALFARIHIVLGRAYAGDVETATQIGERLHASARSTGNPTTMAWTDYALAEAVQLGHPDRAVSLLTTAIERSRGVRSRFVEGVAMVSLATLRARRGELGRALEMFPQLLDHWKRVGDWTHQWTTLRNLAMLLEGAGQPRAAAVLLGAIERSRHITPMFGPEGAAIAETMDRLQVQLTTTEFEEATDKGRSMGDDQILSFALAEIQPS